jgi:DNA-binding transcriptional regulator/RsmH inhibitor MraZ
VTHLHFDFPKKLYIDKGWRNVEIVEIDSSGRIYIPAEIRRRDKS